MADRIDPTQYGFTAGDPDFQDFVPDTAGALNIPQAEPEGVYVDSAELVGYPDHDSPADPLSVRPADYYTRGNTATREVGQPFPFATSQPVYFQDGYLAGLTVRETAGVPAVMNLRDGADAGGKIIATYGLPALGSQTDWFLPGGIMFDRGLYVEIFGSVTGVVHVARNIVL